MARRARFWPTQTSFSSSNTAIPLGASLSGFDGGGLKQLRRATTEGGQAMTPALNGAACRRLAQREHKYILLSLAYFSIRISSPSAQARLTV